MVRLHMESADFSLYLLMPFVTKVPKYVKKTPVASTC